MSLAETLEKKGEERGKEIGRNESKVEIVKEMLKEGIEINLISKISGLSIEDITNLKQPNE